MKGKRIIVLAILILAVLLTACAKESADTDIKIENSSGQIYLYGEMHGNKLIYEKELELWKSYYDKQGMRHLFVELPYYTAELLNLWMKAEDDTILNEVYRDWEGTVVHTEDTLDFYKAIKEQCPETIFHGTDVGHQYFSTGERYLSYLRNNGMTESDQYVLAEENIKQGKEFYSTADDVYRENAMVANFIREFTVLNDADIMGIYGADHTNLKISVYHGKKNVQNMAKQLHEEYGEKLYTEDISWLALNKEALSYETITIGEKEYNAAYFGKQDLSAMLPEYQYREFWEVEDAYVDLKECPTTGNVLPYGNYVMRIEVGKIYLVQYALRDGSTRREVHRADGNVWQGMEITEEINVK